MKKIKLIVLLLGMSFVCIAVAKKVTVNIENDVSLKGVYANVKVRVAGECVAKPTGWILVVKKGETAPFSFYIKDGYELSDCVIHIQSPAKKLRKLSACKIDHDDDLKEGSTIVVEAPPIQPKLSCYVK